MPTLVVEIYARLHFHGRILLSFSSELVLETWPVETEFAHYINVRDHNVDPDVIV